MFQPVEDLIAERYAQVHGAEVQANYPCYCVVGDPAGPRAALGYARAAAERLFVERYIDQPIEIAVSNALGAPVARDRIVEIGAHASTLPPATVALWAQAAALLDADYDVAVAVLTAPLRTMFARLELPFVEVARADAARLDGEAARWGRYYELDPVLCAGSIAPWRAALARWLPGETV